MKMGQSSPWPDAMEVMTGQREFDATALMDYFKPLTDWLIKQNTKNGDKLGWPDSNWMPPGRSGIRVVYKLLQSCICNTMKHL